MTDIDAERQLGIPETALIPNLEVRDGYSVIVEKPRQDRLFEAVPAKIDVSRVSHVMVANEIGPCGGVEAAVLGAQVIAADSLSEQAVYVNARITNGADSTAALEEQGVVMSVDVNDPSIPDGARYAISAHGNRRDLEAARAKGLEVVDLTCIFVDSTHKEIENVAERMSEDQIPTGILYLSVGGRPDHAEFLGSTQLIEDQEVPYVPVFSVADVDRLFDRDDQISLERSGWQRIRIISQTTNDSDVAAGMADEIVDRIRASELDIDTDTFPYNSTDVCRTVRNRQHATQEMVRQGVETLVVMGSVNSKNTKNLVDVAIGTAAELQNNGEEVALQRVIFANSHLQLPSQLEGRVGVVSVASSDQRNIDWAVRTIDPEGTHQVVGDSDKSGARKVFPLVLRRKPDGEQRTQRELNRKIRDAYEQRQR